MSEALTLDDLREARAKLSTPYPFSSLELCRADVLKWYACAPLSEPSNQFAGFAIVENAALPEGIGLLVKSTGKGQLPLEVVILDMRTKDE